MGFATLHTHINFNSNPFGMGSMAMNPRLNFFLGMACATSGMQMYPMLGMPFMGSVFSCPSIGFSNFGMSPNFNAGMNYNFNNNLTFNSSNFGIGSMSFPPVSAATSPVFKYTPGFMNNNIYSQGPSAFNYQSAISTRTVTNPVCPSNNSNSSVGYNSNALPEIGKSSLMNHVPADRKGKILDAVDRACKQYNVDPKLVVSLMYAESAFDPNVTSHCGAAGLMQLMPGTAKSNGANNPYDIEQNIFAGVKFLKWLLDKYNGNKDLAIAAYNAGPGRVKDSIPNIAETKNHVAKVNKAYNSLC